MSQPKKFKRNIKNFVINPTFQMRMALRFIIVYIVVAGILQAFFTVELQKYIESFIKVIVGFINWSNPNEIIGTINIQILLHFSFW